MREDNMTWCSLVEERKNLSERITALKDAGFAVDSPQMATLRVNQHRTAARITQMEQAAGPKNLSGPAVAHR